MSPGPSPNDLTRQQLDELDSLLERMLHLPLPPASATAPAPAALPADWESALLGPGAPLPNGWRLDPPPAGTAPHAAPRPAAEPILAGAAAFAAPPPTARVFGAPAAPAWTPPGVAAPRREPSASTLRGVDAPALPPGVWEAVTLAPRAPTFSAPPIPEPEPMAVLTVAPPPAPPPPPAGWLPVPAPLWPLYAINWVMELALGLLGPLGGLVTHPAAKHLQGGAGLLLLAGAGAWAARGLGWLEF